MTASKSKSKAGALLEKLLKVPTEEIVEAVEVVSGASDFLKKVIEECERVAKDNDAKDDNDSDSSSSSDSSSDSGSDDDSSSDSDGEEEEAAKPKFPPITPDVAKGKKAVIAENGSNADSSSSDSSSSDDSSDDSSDEEEEEPPAKKPKVAEAAEADDSDSDVSDVEVSDVDVSDVESSDDSDSDSDSEDSDDDDDSSSSSSDSSDSDSSDSDSSDSEDEAAEAERLKAKKAAEAERRKKAAIAAANWTPSPPRGNSPAPEIIVKRGTDGAAALGSAGKPFSRVDDEYWAGQIKEREMLDNSYEGTFGDGGFGATASQKLVQVRGKDFRHEKTKRKRSYNGFARNGGGIDQTTRSTKFVYDD